MGKTRFFVFSPYYRAFKNRVFEVQKHVIMKAKENPRKAKETEAKDPPPKDKEEQAKEGVKENTEELEEVIEEKEIHEAEILS